MIRIVINNSIIIFKKKTMKRLTRFICCLPIWCGLILACLISILESLLATIYLATDPTLILSSLALGIFFALPAVNQINLCYRKLLLILYVAINLFQVPFLGVKLFHSSIFERFAYNKEEREVV